MNYRAVGTAPSFGFSVREAALATIGPLTPLLPFEPLGRANFRLMFWCANPGPSAVTLILSTSEQGSLPDAANYQAVIGPGQEGNLDMLNTLFQYWELEAHTDPAQGYPIQTVTWGIVGVARRWGSSQ